MRLFIYFLVTILFMGNGLDSLKRASYECAKHNIPIVIYTEPISTKIAYYNSAEDKIYLNISHGYWENPGKLQEENFKRKWFSSPNQDHVILHEIGHTLLYRHLGLEKFYKIQGKKNIINEKIIKEQVSEYANVDMLEFFSEVYVGLISGMKYSNDIIKEYNNIWNL